MKHSYLALLAATTMVGGVFGNPSSKKQPRKCLLKDCTRETTHNGGYCSAAHCRLDRERRKVL